MDYICEPRIVMASKVLWRCQFFLFMVITLHSLIHIINDMVLYPGHSGHF
jgi:hypothetical protein